MPRLFEETDRRVTVEHLGGLPLVSRRSRSTRAAGSSRSSTRSTASARRSRCSSLARSARARARGAALARPAVLYRQQRVGRDGRASTCSSSARCATATAAALPRSCPASFDDTAPGGVEGDDRRTRVGRSCAANSLDELPQLSTSCAATCASSARARSGPSSSRSFEEHVYRYGDRHRVKSGITGWAQVHGLRGQTSLADRVEWDNYYIENWSLWLDLKILLLTVVAVLRVRSVQ